VLTVDDGSDDSVLAHGVLLIRLIDKTIITNKNFR
jgi:hypothetical protein